MDGHHEEDKKEGFLDTVFDKTVGGFGILLVSSALIIIFLLMLLG